MNKAEQKVRMQMLAFLTEEQKTILIKILKELVQLKRQELLSGTEKGQAIDEAIINIQQIFQKGEVK